MEYPKETDDKEVIRGSVFGMKLSRRDRFLEVWNYFSILKLQRLQPLKFRNEYIISSHTLLGMWLFIYVGIKVKPY